MSLHAGVPRQPTADIPTGLPACLPPLLCAGCGQPGGQLTGDAAQAESERQQLALYGVDD